MSIALRVLVAFVLALLACLMASAAGEVHAAVGTRYETTAHAYQAPATPSVLDSPSVPRRRPPIEAAASRRGASAAVPSVSVAAKSATAIGEHSLDDLSRAAGVVDRNGLSGAGRALQKHGDRVGSAFPGSTGTVAARNAQGQAVVDDILTAPGGRTEVLDNVMNVCGSNTEGVPGVLQKNGNTRDVMRGTQDIGVDRTTGLPTDVYTVIRKPDGSVLTMFPGTSARS